MSKYQPLQAYLEARASLPRVRLTFSEVATIIGAPLPRSAFEYREWWANQTDTSSRSQAAAWQDAGFVVDKVRQESNSGYVEFLRVS